MSSHSPQPRAADERCHQSESARYIAWCSVSNYWVGDRIKRRGRRGAVGEQVWGWMTCIGLAQAKHQTQTKNVEKQQLCPLVSTLGLSGNRTNTCVVYHYLTQKRKEKKKKGHLNHFLGCCQVWVAARVRGKPHTMGSPCFPSSKGRTLDYISTRGHDRGP